MSGKNFLVNQAAKSFDNIVARFRT